MTSLWHGIAAALIPRSRRVSPQAPSRTGGTTRRQNRSCGFFGGGACPTNETHDMQSNVVVANFPWMNMILVCRGCFDQTRKTRGWHTKSLLVHFSTQTR